jgi:hypothetical protein
LRDFLNSGGLIDLSYKENSFTWTNRRMRKANIKERLDRAVANVEWKCLFPKSSVKHLPMLSFDHAPLVVNSQDDLFNGLKYFRFEEAWTRDESSSKVVQEAWVDNSRCTPQYSVMNIIKNVRVKLNWWNKHVFGSTQRRIAVIKEEIEKVQAQDTSEENDEKEKQLQWEYNKCLRREESLWRQKSRVRWLSTSDLNTEFFHIITLIRRRRNHIYIYIYIYIYIF